MHALRVLVRWFACVVWLVIELHLVVAGFSVCGFLSFFSQMFFCVYFFLYFVVVGIIARVSALAFYLASSL